MFLIYLGQFTVIHTKTCFKILLLMFLVSTIATLLDTL